MTLYLYIYTAQLLVSAFLHVSNPGMHAGRTPQPLSTPRTVGPGQMLAVCADRTYRQPTNMQPAPSVIAN